VRAAEWCDHQIQCGSRFTCRWLSAALPAARSVNKNCFVDASRGFDA